jgi:pilus assembly protein Flp/PilA
MFALLRLALNFYQTRKPGFLRDERGVTTIEYGILAAGLAIIITTLVLKDGAFFDSLHQVFKNVVENLPQQEDSPAAQ